MTKVEAALDFFGKTVLYATLIVTCSYLGGVFARADEPCPSTKAGHPVQKAKSVPKEKVQYEADSEEMSPVTEKKIPAEEKDGAYYEAGSEAVVTSEPDVSIKDQPVEEKSPEPNVNSPKVAGEASL